VNLSNGMDSGAITGTSYSFSLANGTYSYTIATSDKTYEPSPSSGPFTVNGAPVSKSVSFSEVTYTVTFTESGLPSGTSWKMTFNGVMNSSTNSVMTFSAPNGTYSFSTSNLSSYYTLNYSGSISVKGNGVSIPIVYYHYAYISGTVTPHNATVDINGHSVSVTSSGSFNVSEASGTYYVVVSESGYTTSYNNVTLTAGQTKELNVTLNPVKTTPPPISSSFPSVDLYGIIGVVVAIVAVVAVVSLMRKKH
ncbi:MAG: PEGA domain-containing protein, partial [Candidatus Thermoplasmatota archaeon]|nr:PEGA domain-containing protein [Candidatus Thermoplasmatota archaeon]